jgi:multiple sugar transport system substrate-binding protein
MMVGLVKDGALHPSSLEETNSVASVDLFTQGDAAMFIGPPPTLVTAADPDKSKVVGKVAVALMPGGSVHRSATYHETGARAIAFNARHKEAAWQYIQYVIQPEQMVEMALTLGRVPARKSALNDPRVQEEYPLAAMVDKQLSAGPGGMVIVHEKGTQIGKALADHISFALHGEKTPQQALADAEQEILGIINQ